MSPFKVPGYSPGTGFKGARVSPGRPFAKGGIPQLSEGNFFEFYISRVRGEIPRKAFRENRGFKVCAQKGAAGEPRASRAGFGGGTLFL